MKATKKVLAVIMALCMAIGCFAVIASAADPDSTAALQAAINAASGSYKWTGAAKIHVTAPIVIDKAGEFTLDLGGARLYGDGCTAIQVKSGTVTIQNGIVHSMFGDLLSAETKETIRTGRAEDALDAVKATLADLRTDSDPAIRVYAGADVTLYGVIAVGNYANISSMKIPAYNEKIGVTAGSAVIVSSGAKLTVDNSGLVGFYAIKNLQGSQIVINDAVLLGLLGSFRYKAAGNITIAEGTSRVDVAGRLNSLVGRGTDANPQFTEQEIKAIRLILDGGYPENPGRKLYNPLNGEEFEGMLDVYVADAKMDAAFEYDFETETLTVTSTLDDSNLDADLADRFQYYWAPESVTVDGVTAQFADNGDGTYTATLNAEKDGDATVRYRLYYKLGATNLNVFSDFPAFVSQCYTTGKAFYSNALLNNAKPAYDTLHARAISLAKRGISGVIEYYGAFNTLLQNFENKQAYLNMIQALCADLVHVVGLDVAREAVAIAKADIQDPDSDAYKFYYNVIKKQAIQQAKEQYPGVPEADIEAQVVASGRIEAALQENVIDPILNTTESQMLATLGINTNADIIYGLPVADRIVNQIVANGDDVFATIRYLKSEYSEIMATYHEMYAVLSDVLAQMATNEWATLKRGAADGEVAGFSLGGLSNIINLLGRAEDLCNELNDILVASIESAYGREALARADRGMEKYGAALDDVINAAENFCEHPELYINFKVENNSLELYSDTDVFPYEFEEEGEVAVTAAVEGGGTVTMTDLDTEIASETTKRYDAGEVVTLTATPDDGCEFIYWVNGETNKILSLDAEFDYTAYNYNKVLAVFNDPDDGDYKAYVGGLMTSNTGDNPAEGLGSIIEEGNDIAAPAASRAAIPGYDTLGFELVDVSGTDSHAEIYAMTYAVSEGYVTFSVVGGKAAVDTNGDGKLTEDEVLTTNSVPYNTVVTLIADNDEAHFEVDGQVASAGSSYSFLANISGLTYTAVSGTTEGGIFVAGTVVANGQYFIYTQRGLVEGTVGEVGVLLNLNGNATTKETLTVAGTAQEGIYRAKAKQTTAFGTYAPQTTATTCWFRAYVTLTNGETIYSPVYARNGDSFTIVDR